MSSQTNSQLALPETLTNWRASGHDIEGKYPRDIWTPLEPFLHSLGYTLWQTAYFTNLVPPNSNERAPDGFAYRTYMNDIDRRPSFGQAGVPLSHCLASLSLNFSLSETDTLSSQIPTEPRRSRPSRCQGFRRS